jgi:SAM-dependent methyltransferase
VLEDHKRAEAEYPSRVNAEHRRWLETKPFQGEPRHTVRHLIDVGYIVDLLELNAGSRFLELGCGSGWLTRYAARCGAEAVGYDISPEMIEIARAEASREGLDARFEVADMEALKPEGTFDRCLIYEALHHSTNPVGVLEVARRALRPGGTLLVSEPNSIQRFRGRAASKEFGTTELGISPHRLRRMFRQAGFSEIRRFHSNRRRLYGNGPRDIAMHLLEPLAFRALAPFWTQVWMRGTVPPPS